MLTKIQVLAHLFRNLNQPRLGVIRQEYSPYPIISPLSSQRTPLVIPMAICTQNILVLRRSKLELLISFDR